MKIPKTFGLALIGFAILVNPHVLQRFFLNINFSTSLFTYFSYLFFVFGVLILFSFQKKFNKQISRIYLNFFTLFFTVFCIMFFIEFISFMIIINNSRGTELLLRFTPEKDFPNSEFYEFNNEIGYHGKPNATLHETKRSIFDGSIIYNVTYTLDNYGRRVTEKKGNTPHIILFGCSTVFSDGLNDNETLASYLSTMTEFQVYNYAFRGYGTQQMLAHLERESFEKEILNKKGIAIYYFINEHLRRTIGDMIVYNKWGSSMPYYYLDKNKEVIRIESFKTGRKIVSLIYSFLGRSYFFKYFNINLPFKNKMHSYLTYKIIEKAKNLYESKFNGRFYVLLFRDKYNEDLFNLLKENNISVLTPNLELKNEYFIPEDGHPTSELNKVLSSKIVEQLFNG